MGLGSIVGPGVSERSWPLLTLFSLSSFFFSAHCFSPTSGVPRKLIYGPSHLTQLEGLWTNSSAQSLVYILFIFNLFKFHQNLVNWGGEGL